MLLPIIYIESSVSGPTVCAIGGTHGNELAGCMATLELFKLRPDCGRLITIPQENFRAVKQNLREIPGESDLKCCYPGKKTGILMENLLLTVVAY